MKEPISAAIPVMIAAIGFGIVGGLYYGSMLFFQATTNFGVFIAACLLLWQQYRWGWVG